MAFHFKSFIEGSNRPKADGYVSKLAIIHSWGGIAFPIVNSLRAKWGAMRPMGTTNRIRSYQDSFHIVCHPTIDSRFS